MEIARDIYLLRKDLIPKGFKKPDSPSLNVASCVPIRTAAVAKGDSRIIAIVSRELVATEERYHRSCHCDYTRPDNKVRINSSGQNDKSDTGGDKYAYIVTRIGKLLQFIRLDLLENPRLISMTDLRKLLFISMCSMGMTEI